MYLECLNCQFFARALQNGYNKFHFEYKNSHLKYLTDRGLSKNTIQNFKIGYCEDSKKIQEKLYSNNFTSEELIKSGMYYKKDQSDELVSRFRNRIIFPILNYYNQFVGCGGRSR